jgi:hypothetical protein
MVHACGQTSCHNFFFGTQASNRIPCSNIELCNQRKTLPRTSILPCKIMYGIATLQRKVDEQEKTLAQKHELQRSIVKHRLQQPHHLPHQDGSPVAPVRRLTPKHVRSLSRDSYSTFTTAAETPGSSTVLTVTSRPKRGDSDAIPIEICFCSEVSSVILHRSRMQKARFLPEPMDDDDDDDVDDSSSSSSSRPDNEDEEEVDHKGSMSVSVLPGFYLNNLNDDAAPPIMTHLILPARTPRMLNTRAPSMGMGMDCLKAPVRKASRSKEATFRTNRVEI